jgi:hypothetical protein
MTFIADCIPLDSIVFVYISKSQHYVTPLIHSITINVYHGSI